jgi:glycosyltransferase involved in cell wall biosynthesis
MGVHPGISVLTPVGESNTEFLFELAEDIQSLKSIIGYELVEWVVVLDGFEEPTEIGLLPIDRLVLLPIHGGPAAARNLALSSASNEWIIPADSDDRFNAYEVAQVLAELGKTNDDWVGFSRTLLDGKPTPHTVKIGIRLEAGVLATKWTSPLMFHPNSIIVRRSAANRVGGWPALPVNEDLAFVLRISEDSGGNVLTNKVTLYRRWERQLLSMRNYPEGKAAAFLVIESFLNAYRRSRGRDPIMAPLPGGAFGREEVSE